ncbi:MAG TPA: Hsp20/alpha crystallin family protein [Candidatus Paceibacterota bacterium]|nr:Hsp20/alpha crystallin family protein [Verrucomicrobiota bacterium]HSA12419.1 Hsp20/alpha crystallin family protein [Candidatus Paceibacterota bacterium]
MKATVQTDQRPKVEPRLKPDYVLPEVDIFETKDGYVVEAEMPGVSKDGLEITLEGNEISIVGHRKNDVAAGTPLFRERSLADYRRVFEMDPAIDTSKIAAKMDQGVLTLTLPKSEEVKPRRVRVD